MPSEDVAVAEPTSTDAPNVDAVEAEAPSSAAPDTPDTPASSKRVHVTHPSSGEPISMTAQERDWLAQQGFVALAEKRAAKEAAVEVKPDVPVVVDEPEDMDPVAKRMSQLESQIESTKQAYQKLEDRERVRQATEDARGRKDDRQRMLDALARQHGLEGADPVYRKMVEHRADDLADQAIAESRIVTQDECFKLAAKEIGSRVAEGARTQWEGKKRVRESAAEPSSGTSAAEMAPPVFAKTKAEERVLAAKMADGSITVEANEHFKKIMDGAGV